MQLILFFSPLHLYSYIMSKKCYVFIARISFMIKSSLFGLRKHEKNSYSRRTLLLLHMEIPTWRSFKMCWVFQFRPSESMHMIFSLLIGKLKFHEVSVRKSKITYNIACKLRYISIKCPNWVFNFFLMNRTNIHCCPMFIITKSQAKSKQNCFFTK